MQLSLGVSIPGVGVLNSKSPHPKHGKSTLITKNNRVANSHAYGVILTHLTCYSRTHTIDKFTHAFKINHTHTYAIL